MDDEREIDRHRVIALVDQPLGDVERREAFRQSLVAEQRLVHARTRRREGRVEHIFQAAQHIVGVEYGILGDLLEPVGTGAERSEEHTSELQYLMRNPYA